MAALRIGVDARELLGAVTGVGRYLGELMGRWTARDDSSERTFVLYSPEPLRIAYPQGTTEIRVLPGGRGTWWEQRSLRGAVRADRLDVYFAPAYTAPLGIRVPLAVTIHDVSFVAHPEWFRVVEGLRRRWLTRHAADVAQVIFTDSQFSRREIQTHLGVSPARIHVIPPGVSPPVHPPASMDGREPLVLFAGSLFNRRRLPDLIAAFARATVDLPAARLVIVGDNRTWPPQDLAAEAGERGVASRTELLSYVSGERLADLYSRASTFAFLSEYEGFGLTPLEALASGVPVVVLDTPVAREVYGDAAVFVPPGDVPAAAAALRRFLTDPASRAAILARAPDVLARYSWDRAAADTLDHLERVAGR